MKNNNQDPNIEKQGKPAFSSTEKRFNWMNKYCNGNDIHRKKHKNKIYSKDNLEGGIGKFMRIKPKNDTKIIENIDKMYDADYIKIKNKYINDYNKYNFTQRVLCPENNPEKAKINKIRTYNSQEKILRHKTDGTYKSLMLITPEKFPIRGRKRINKSIECGNKPDNILFYEDKLEECNKDNNRLFGVERKHRVKGINIESEKQPYKFGRKHFFDKEKNTAFY